MSDLQRSFARAHLHKLPPQPAPIPDEHDEEAEEPAELPSPSQYDSSSSASSTGTIVPSPGRNLFERPSATATSREKYSPLSWQDFFSQELTFQNVDQNLQHHAYLIPPASNGPLFVTHHGAGSSGLSFATFAHEILQLIPNAGVLSPDAREHGLTTHISPGTDSKPDFSLPTLSSDLAFIISALQDRFSWSELPPMILIGHSLGGAVVVDLAHRRHPFSAAILGFAVLDVVEGSAMDALSSMETYLSSRPKFFPSLTSGIEWHVRSRTIRHTRSARVSVPALLEQDRSVRDLSAHADSLLSALVWRTNLLATKPFWESWFTNLSSKFLSSPGGKLLILAGTDRLDKELMIGQMQGKYQLQVFPEAGHFVHEDSPAKTAMILCDFWKRNDRSTLVLPPKVGDLIAQGKMADARDKTR